MLLQTSLIISYPSVNSNWSYSAETPNLGSKSIETVSPEGTFCDTVQVPSRGGDMVLI